MPYHETKLKGGKVRVTGPHRVMAEDTTPEKAKRQMDLLRGLEHGWHPTQRRGGNALARRMGM